MSKAETLDQKHDWDYLLTFLPDNWKGQAKESGALLRCRKFADAELLLRTLLIHLADGCSLRETAVRASHGKIVSISDVALLKRLRASGEWFRWMAVSLMQQWIDKQPTNVFNKNRTIRIIDGSTIQEPGNTGSTWRLHYSISLPSLRCDEVYVTPPKTGESFKLYQVNKGDVFLGDRGYARRSGIYHVVDNGGDVLVRLNMTNVPLVDEHGKSFHLLKYLKTIKGTQIGDWDTWLANGNKMISGRICAIKKNKSATEKARKKAKRKAAQRGQKVKKETLEAAAYIFVFTTLDRKVNPTTILEMYRGRWHIELVFKRLKSIIGLGHLKKYDFDAAQGWIHGKLFVAFLIEAMIAAGERFFPWGYPIRKEIS
jgi:hypothetical protein